MEEDLSKEYKWSTEVITIKLDEVLQKYMYLRMENCCGHPLLLSQPFYSYEITNLAPDGKKLP